MLKLYKQIEDQLHYWETWDKTDKIAIVHWGIVGEEGLQEEIKSGLFSNFRKEVQKKINQLLSEGYKPIDDDDLITLLIEYKVNDMGAPEDLEKRHKLEDRMNQTLGWTGLGNCDGGSIGTGTMEVCCLVVDFDIAKKVIEDDLRGTAFSDYIHIYNENES